MDSRPNLAAISKYNAGKQTVDATIQEWSECLVKVGRDKDRAAFRRLFDKFSPLIKAFAGRQLSSDLHDGMAEDLVQETMIKVWQKAESFDPKKANASTWIFTIARNTRIDLLRKNIRHQSNRVANDHAEDGFDVEDIWVENEDEDVFKQLAMQRTAEMLKESMKDLPEEQSFILEKVYLEDKSHSEIAEELSLPLGTVKSRVRLALSKLRLSVER
jgi:RNA polymerase sigma-70 factor (ECF subfamily)